MNVEQFILLGIGFGLVLASLKFAQRGKVIPTMVLAVLAWAAYVVPKWLIWPIPDLRDIRWLLFVGTVVLIGGPLTVLLVSKRKQKPHQ